MLKSMTGFGRAEEQAESYIITIQIKSVNHRYADFTVKVPRYYSFLEDKIRNEAAKVISRGKVEILAGIERKGADDRKIVLNRELAEEYVNALRGLTEFGVRDDLSISTMSGINDIFDVEYKEIDEEHITEMVLGVLRSAVDEFLAMRIAEGERLGESLNGHLDSLASEIEIIERRSPECVEEYRNRLKRKIEEVLADRVADETRIITEAAVFADKIAVDEETVRLKSHICAFKNTMKSNEPVGKKLDFIVQEMNREANTIGSKCNDADVASHVVEIKSIIEKIREQIQNIE